jgi:dihydroxyacetone kinase-like predicted kinase
MAQAKENVTTAYVTTATRDTNMDGVEIEKGKYIGIENKTIKICSENKLECAKATIKSVTDECEKDVIIVFSGASVSETENEELRAFLENNYPLCDIGFVDGGQEVYDFIISLE